MLRKILLILPLFLLAACAEGELAAHMAKQIPLPGERSSRNEGTFKVGNPYKVDGKWYKPKEAYSFSETGIASWYGPNFHGKQTANGEIFDMNELTAAHRTLQMPSLVRVTNLENGRSLIVRINDRGPFKRGRVIDVSKRAAELLGFRSRGTAKVRVDVLSEESRKIAEAARSGQSTKGFEVAMNENRLRQPTQPVFTTSGGQTYSPAPPAAPYKQKPPPSPLVDQTAVSAPKPDLVRAEALDPPEISGHMKDGNFLPDPVVTQMPVTKTSIFIQAGSFSDQANAVRYAQQLSSYGSANVYPAIVNNRQYYRVRLGPIDTVDEADALLSSLAESGKNDAIIIVD